jgi:hypothetical protein
MFGEDAHKMRANVHLKRQAIKILRADDRLILLSQPPPGGLAVLDASSLPFESHSSLLDPIFHADAAAAEPR